MIYNVDSLSRYTYVVFPSLPFLSVFLSIQYFGQDVKGKPKKCFSVPDVSCSVHSPSPCKLKLQLPWLLLEVWRHTWSILWLNTRVHFCFSFRTGIIPLGREGCLAAGAEDLSLRPTVQWQWSVNFSFSPLAPQRPRPSALCCAQSFLSLPCQWRFPESLHG